MSFTQVKTASYKAHIQAIYGLATPMPPRSYYIDPKVDDYLAYASAYFPDDLELCKQFSLKTGLPFVDDAKHIAGYLGVSASLVRQIILRPSFHYRSFEIPKKDGAQRKITTPRTYLKVIQWWILDNILSSAQIDNNVHGFCLGRSYLSNAKMHLGSRHILNVDIKKFFPSITSAMVKECFSNFGYSDNGAQLLADLTTYQDVAPTGAPTSPLIGNLVLANLDHDMRDFSNASGLNYTRYADDLTFSSSNWIEADVLSEVSRLVEKHGFSLNKKKTKFMGPGDRMEVTGLVINETLNFSRAWRNSTRGYLHRVLNNPEQFRKDRAKVAGLYGALKAVDPEMKQRLTVSAYDALQLLSNGTAFAPSKP